MEESVLNGKTRPLKVTFNRQRTPIKIFINGLKGGEIFRGEGRYNFLLSLDHVCWQKGEPAEGGQSVLSFRTVREAKKRAIEVAPKVGEFRERFHERRVASEGDDPDQSWYA